MQSTVQLTVQCQSCTSKHGTPPYVDLPSHDACSTIATTTFTPARQASHCPRCGKPRTFHPYDYADTLCQEYFGLTRAAAIAALHLFNELRATDNHRRTYTYTAMYNLGTSAHPLSQVHAGTQVLVNEQCQSTPAKLAAIHSARDIYDYLDNLKGGPKRMLQRGYIAPLDCTCKACGGQFTLVRGIVDTQATPPLYCVWCGARSQLITDPTQTEETAWIVLADNYKLPIAALKIFYGQWSATMHKHPTFQSYMQSEEVQQLLPLLQAANQTLTTAVQHDTTVEVN